MKELEGAGKVLMEMDLIESEVELSMHLSFFVSNSRRVELNVKSYFGKFSCF